MHPIRLLSGLLFLTHLDLSSSENDSDDTSLWSPGSLIGELSAPLLRLRSLRIWNDPPSEDNGPTTDSPNTTSGNMTASLRRQSPYAGTSTPPPPLELVDLESYCFGHGEFLQLGPCSSTFLKCRRLDDSSGFINGQSPFTLEECPLGKVFHNTQCVAAHQVRNCFNSEVNAVNDATEKLAQVIPV